MVALDKAYVAAGARNIGTVTSPPGHCVEQVMGGARSESPSHTTPAEMEEACEVDVEVAVTGSGSKELRSWTIATLVVDGLGAGAAVDGSGKAAWRLAIFSAHTGSRLTLSSSRSMRRLPASPNMLVRRLAVSSEAYLDLCRAASTAASIEEASSDFQSMELRGEGWWRWEFEFVGKILPGILGIFRGGFDWL
jgi:hypothetical protein